MDLSFKSTSAVTRSEAEVLNVLIKKLLMQNNKNKQNKFP